VPRDGPARQVLASVPRIDYGSTVSWTATGRDAWRSRPCAQTSWRSKPA